MASFSANGRYPRALRPKERELLDSVLPAERAGYKRYRDLVASLTVIGEGQMGKGNLILGPSGRHPDLREPLSSVIAYGVVETTSDTFTVTVREYGGGQLDVEIVSAHGDEVPERFEEKRRWTYSTWTPGDSSPSTGAPVREVTLDDRHVLVVSREEKRIWVYDGTSEMNILIPITNFYNELMLLKGVRDPRVALSPSKFFDDLGTYTDLELVQTFSAYNRIRPKVTLAAAVEAAQEGGMRAFFKGLFRRK